MSKQTIYKERSNGRWEYWCYCDGARCYVSIGYAIKEVESGRAHEVVVR